MSETAEKVRYRCEGCGEAVPERDVVDGRHPVQVEDGDVDFCGPVRAVVCGTCRGDRWLCSRCGIRIVYRKDGDPWYCPMCHAPSSRERTMQGARKLTVSDCPDCRSPGRVAKRKVHSAPKKGSVSRATSKKAVRKATEHGRTCEKVSHGAGGYLHAPDYDGPYEVDGVRYCGRCHVALPARSPEGEVAMSLSEGEVERCPVCGDPLQAITRGGRPQVCPDHGWPDVARSPEGEVLTREAMYMARMELEVEVQDQLFGWVKANPIAATEKMVRLRAKLEAAERERDAAKVTRRHRELVIARLTQERDGAWTKLKAAEWERERLREGLKIARYSPLGDNHHNAAACPHCNPGGLTLDQLRARHAALREAVEEAAEQIEVIAYEMESESLSADEDVRCDRLLSIASRLAEAGGEGGGDG